MKKKKIVTLLLVLVGLLMVTFFVRDWLVFIQCGAVEQCLVDESNYQNIAKFAVTAIMTVIVFFIGKNCLCLTVSFCRRALPWRFVRISASRFCTTIRTFWTTAAITLCLAFASLWWCRLCSFSPYAYKRYGQFRAVGAVHSVWRDVHCKCASPL